MKKFALLLILLMGIGFVACEQQTIDNDPLYPSPEALVVNDEACTENSIAIMFDGRAAIEAGAKTFTSKLVPVTAGQELSISKDAISKDACSHIFESVPVGVYTASVRAIYPDGTPSETVQLKDSKGEVVKLRIGSAALEAKAVYATSSTLAFTWSVTGFDDAAKDRATAYSFGIYRDAACKDLIVSWQTKESDSIWDGDLADGYPQFEFSGLNSNTSYWFMVTELKSNTSTAPIEAKTLDFAIVEPSATAMVEAGGIAIAEDFSELVWGGNYLSGSAAYSADDRNLATAFDKAEGVNPVSLKAHPFMSDEERDALLEQYKHPIIKEVGEVAKKVGGHGGMDFIMDYRLVYCLRNGLPLDMDVYDLAEWSCPAALSSISIAHGSAPVAVPDFTRGAWKKIDGYKFAFAE